MLIALASVMSGRTGTDTRVRGQTPNGTLLQIAAPQPRPIRGHAPVMQFAERSATIGWRYADTSKFEDVYVEAVVLAGNRGEP